MGSSALVHSDLRDAALAAFTPLSTRLTLLVATGRSPAWVDVRGLVADLAVGLLFAALLSVTRGRSWRRLELALWSLAHYAQLLHVAALDAPLDFTQWRLALDPTFLAASGLDPRFVWVLGIWLTLAWVGPPSASDEPRRAVGLGLAGAGLGLAFAGFAWLAPQPRITAGWRGEHFLLPTPTAGTRASPQPEGGALGPSLDPHRLGPPDRPRWDEKPDVVLLFLEGLSAAWLESMDPLGPDPERLRLPELDAIARNALRARRLVLQQRQTHRGLWTTLCGLPPRFDGGQALFVELARGELDPDCLPRLLGRAGWETHFLQASPLGYMMKGEALRRMGFDRVEGLEHFLTGPAGEARSRWGVGDATLLDAVAEELAQRDPADPPIFLSALTVGTHHPYTVPPAGRGRATTPLGDALLEADRAVGRFVRSLQEAPRRRPLLLLITSDEAAGVESGTDWQRQRSQNVGLFLALQLGPEPTLAPTTGPDLLQQDLARTLLELLDLEAPASMAPWSLYRPDRPLPWLFSNAHLQRAYAWRGDRLTICDQQLRSCQTWELSPPQPFADPTGELGLDREAVEALRAATRASAPAGGERRYSLADLGACELPPDSTGLHLFGGQYLDVEPGSAIEVELRGSVPIGSGWVHLRHDLVSVGEGKHYLADLPPLGPGDSFELRYRVLAPAGLHGLDTRAVLDPLTTPDTKRVDTLVLEAATLRITPEATSPAPQDGVRVEILARSVDRRAPPPTLHLGLPDLATADQPPCVESGSWGLRSCVAGLSLAGPRFFAPTGSLIRARLELADVEGTLQGTRWILGAEDPPIVVEAAVTTPNAVFELEHRVAVTVDQLLFGLLWPEGLEAARVEGLEVEIELP